MSANNDPRQRAVTTLDGIDNGIEVLTRLSAAVARVVAANERLNQQIVGALEDLQQDRNQVAALIEQAETDPSDWWKGNVDGE